jgi:hypothetical protein
MHPDSSPVTLIDGDSEETVDTENVIGVDESGDSGSGAFAVVAVRCSRSDDVRLVRALIESDLRPFEHKSSSLVRYESLNLEARRERVEELLQSLHDAGVSWSAVLFDGPVSLEQRAAGCAMAIKKSVTNGLNTRTVTRNCGDTAILHDGQPDTSSQYFESLRRQLPSHCNTAFERSICLVHLAFLEQADQTYPQSNTADYLAGYLREVVDGDLAGDGDDHLVLLKMDFAVDGAVDTVTHADHPDAVWCQLRSGVRV